MNKCTNNKRPPFAFNLYKVCIIGIGILLLLGYLYQNSSFFYRKTITLPFSLHLSKQDLYLAKGEEYRLCVFGINKRVSYYSTNFRVAGVNFNGRISAHQTGKTFIIAKVDGKQLKCRVHVIDLNKKKLVIKRGRSYQLHVKGTASYVRWRSSDTTVATVNIFGKVKARKKGNAVIYAKIKGKVLSCNVRIK